MIGLREEEAQSACNPERTQLRPMLLEERKNSSYDA
jgi:hypothetical protein